MLDSQGSRPDFRCGQGVKHENLLGRDLDPGRGWRLCSVPPLSRHYSIPISSRERFQRFNSDHRFLCEVDLSLYRISTVLKQLTHCYCTSLILCPHPNCAQVWHRTHPPLPLVVYALSCTLIPAYSSVCTPSVASV